MKLERKEFLLCVDGVDTLTIEKSVPSKDQIGRTIAAAIKNYNLDEKWNVNRNVFLEKLNNGTEEDFKKLWQDIEQYWAKRDRE
jgi:hypothetical protein